MAINKGVAPPVMTSDLGRLRAILGDLEYTELTPPEVGFGSYKFFGDAELEAFLETGESIQMAAYFAYMQLSASAAIAAKSVKDQDLSIDNTKTPTELRLIAQSWKDQADALGADVFEMFDTTIDDGCGCTPEASPRMVCGRCSNGVRFL